MPNIESVATYHLTLDTQNRVIQTNGEAFPSDTYSRMKYGVIPDTRILADGLAATICEEMPSVVYDGEAPAFVVAYEALPHAATILAKFCLDSVNTERTSAGLDPGGLLRIHTTDYMEPYSHRPLAEREQILQEQAGIVRDEGVEGRAPVIIDDIRVTGSQERWFHSILSSCIDKPIRAAYVAAFSNDAPRPELEGSLDDACIATLYDLLPYIANSEVVVTHKLVRDLLLCPPDELPYFLERMPDNIKETVAHGIANMSDDTLRPYQINYRTILDSCATRY